METRTVTLTTTEAAVLALLAIEGEQSAYDLTKAVDRAIGHIWSPAKSGLYATLPRLAKDGRAALDAWLETVEPGARETFFLKLFVGGLTTPAVLLEHLDQFVADTGERLEGYYATADTNTGRGHDRYHRFLLDHAIQRAELELEWAADVDAELRRR